MYDLVGFSGAGDFSGGAAFDYAGDFGEGPGLAWDPGLSDTGFSCVFEPSIEAEQTMPTGNSLLELPPPDVKPPPEPRSAQAPAAAPAVPERQSLLSYIEGFQVAYGPDDSASQSAGPPAPVSAAKRGEPVGDTAGAAPAGLPAWVAALPPVDPNAYSLSRPDDAFGRPTHAQGAADGLSMEPTRGRGNALGEGLVTQSRNAPMSGSGLKLEPGTVENWGPRYSFDDTPAPADYSLTGGGSVRLGAGGVESQPATSGDSPARQDQLARMMRLADEAEALGSVGTPFRVDISGVGSTDPEHYNSQVVWFANKHGEDLAPTIANAARLRLAPVDGGLSGVELAQRFGQGLVGAIMAATVEPVLQVRDMGMALASLTYNELIRSDGDAHWLPEMKSGMAEAYANGASQARLLMQSNPLTGVGILSYDLTTASMNRDWGAVAEMGGGVLSGFALGKAASAYGGYGVRWAPGGIGTMPMQSQRGTTSLLDFELVKPGNPVSEGLAYRLDLPEHLVGPDGFTKSGQLSGTHNLKNATAALDAKAATYSLTPTATDGISELSYSYVKPTSGKTITGSKTVYDPAVLSDKTMLDYSLKAGQQGWSRYLVNSTTTSFDVTHGGVNFRTYINVDQYGNPYIGNVHPIK